MQNLSRIFLIVFFCFSAASLAQQDPSDRTEGPLTLLTTGRFEKMQPGLWLGTTRALSNLLRVQVEATLSLVGEQDLETLERMLGLKATSASFDPVENLTSVILSVSLGELLRVSTFPPLKSIQGKFARKPLKEEAATKVPQLPTDALVISIPELSPVDILQAADFGKVAANLVQALEASIAAAFDQKLRAILKFSGRINEEDGINRYGVKFNMALYSPDTDVTIVTASLSLLEILRISRDQQLKVIEGSMRIGPAVAGCSRSVSR